MDEPYAELVRRSDQYKSDKSSKHKEETSKNIKEKDTDHYDWCVKHHGKISWFFVGV